MTPLKARRHSHAPTFPRFKSVAVDDRETIEALVHDYPPYSDFNFVSLLSWSTDDSGGWSTRSGNLVVRFRDYVSGEPFFSLLGRHELLETVSDLVDLARAEGIDPVLRLVPEVVVDGLGRDLDGVAVEDEDNHDYVFAIEDLARCPASRFRGKRGSINRFVRLFGSDVEVEHVDLSDAAKVDAVIQVFSEWVRSRGVHWEQAQHELAAIERLMAHVSRLDVAALGVSLGGQLQAFSISEVVQHGFAISHFEKANVDYAGLFEFLRQQTAADLFRRGCQRLNHEQDLGIPGIRRLKQSYHPVGMLRKYSLAIA